MSLRAAFTELAIAVALEHLYQAAQKDRWIHFGGRESWYRVQGYLYETDLRIR